MKCINCGDQFTRPKPGKRSERGISGDPFMCSARCWSYRRYALKRDQWYDEIERIRKDAGQRFKTMKGVSWVQMAEQNLEWLHKKLKGRT